ncbi:hypothetical protein [uncultured Acinetobacter sp.]|uniref:hypothetical protein n=1 Tax=uncultured Acinetobacter sp. TaxID=165433 RepID=UPI002582C311|nr:hypothetical protein [uncultured Acinetobacter sp.]
MSKASIIQTQPTRIFSFERVYPYSAFQVLWMCVPVLLVFVLIYVYVVGTGFHLGPVSLLFLLYFGTVAGLVRMFSKQVQIWFDASCMYVQLGQALPQCYAKADIVGFYSYDYATQAPALKSSKICIHFYLRNGQKIMLNDSDYRRSVDESSQIILKQFLQTAQRELNFLPVRQRYKHYADGVYWYSDASRDID